MPLSRTRNKKHIRNVKTFASGCSVAKHAWSLNQNIDFNNSTLIDKDSFHIRKTLES